MTFREPESARKACEDPTPVIDGRRANCNLALLGRAQHPVPFGTLLLATALHFACFLRANFEVTLPDSIACRQVEHTAVIYELS